VPSQRQTILLASALLLLASAPAFAHAHLVKAVPAAGGMLHDPPSEVTLRFNEKLEPAFSAVIVRDAAGKQIDKGDRTLIRVTLPALEPGVYKVEWRAMSADTHKINGDFTFKVGQ
jgi:methionine-rich copper-binding protein CopC